MGETGVAAYSANEIHTLKMAHNIDEIRNETAKNSQVKFFKLTYILKFEKSTLNLKFYF